MCVLLVLVVAALARIELLALDVDGVLTDGRIHYGDQEETLSFCVQDGQGMRFLADAGVRIAWISGRGSRATERRARELGVHELHLRVGSKRETLAALQARLGLGIDATAAMGDDLPDLGLFALAGVCAAPANARPEVRECAHIVTRSRGGEGAVRELIEHILRAKQRWHELVLAHGA